MYRQKTVLTHEQLLPTSSCWIVRVDNGGKQGLSQLRWTSEDMTS